jgi:hypothetical protein
MNVKTHHGRGLGRALRLRTEGITTRKTEEEGRQTATDTIDTILKVDKSCGHIRRACLRGEKHGRGIAG